MIDTSDPNLYHDLNLMNSQYKLNLDKDRTGSDSDLKAPYFVREPKEYLPFASEAVMNQFRIATKSLYELQKNCDTFLEDPDESVHKQYNCWLEIIEDQLSDDRISRHVNSSEVLKNQYSKLVPEVVDHQVFWKRYLFKKALLEDDFARQEALEKREKKEKQLSEEILTWDKEDFAVDIELTEEEQINLLEQYEKERNSQKSSTLLIEKQNVPTKQGNNGKNTESKQKSKEEESTESTKLKKNNSNASLGSTPSSSSSLDGDWEKISAAEK